jgi:hypothetical protein
VGRPGVVDRVQLSCLDRSVHVHVGEGEPWRGALGLATYARRWVSDDDQRLRAFAARGITLEQAAEQLGRTPEALRRRAHRTGIPCARLPAFASLGAALERRGGRAAAPAPSAEPGSPSCSNARTPRCASGCAPWACASAPSDPRITPPPAAREPLPPANAYCSTASSCGPSPADAKPSPIDSAMPQANCPASSPESCRRPNWPLRMRHDQMKSALPGPPGSLAQGIGDRKEPA